MKIVVGGQIDKEDIASIVRKELGDQAEVTVKGDLDATMGMKAGQYDYYLGACNTGGGAEPWQWRLRFWEKPAVRRCPCRDRSAARRRFGKR